MTTKPATRKLLKQLLTTSLSPARDRAIRKELRYLALRRYKPKNPPDVYLIYLNLATISLDEGGIGSDFLWSLTVEYNSTPITGDTVEECLDKYNDSLLLSKRAEYLQKGSKS